MIADTQINDSAKNSHKDHCKMIHFWGLRKNLTAVRRRAGANVKRRMQNFLTVKHKNFWLSETLRRIVILATHQKNHHPELFY